MLLVSAPIYFRGEVHVARCADQPCAQVSARGSRALTGCGRLTRTMGIPRLYRWLVERYPGIVRAIQSPDAVCPIDALHLDMNGIVHNCSHPNDAGTTLRCSFVHSVLYCCVRLTLCPAVW